MSEETTQPTDERITYSTKKRRIATRLSQLWGTEHFRPDWFSLVADFHALRAYRSSKHEYRLGEHVDLDLMRDYRIENFRVASIYTVSRDGTTLLHEVPDEAVINLTMRVEESQVFLSHRQDVKFGCFFDGKFVEQPATVHIEIRIANLGKDSLSWMAVNVEGPGADLAQEIEATFAIDQVIPAKLVAKLNEAFTPEALGTASKPFESIAHADMHDSLHAAATGADAAARKVVGLDGRKDVSHYSEAELIDIANNQPSDGLQRPWWRRLFSWGK